MGGRGMELEALWFVALWLLIFCSEFCKAFCKWWRNVEPNVCLSFHTLFSIFRRLFFQERWGGGWELLIINSRQNVRGTPLSSQHSAKVREKQGRYGLIWNISVTDLDAITTSTDSQRGEKRKGNREKRTSIAPAFNFPCRLAGYLPPHLLLQNLLSSPVPTALCTQSDAWLHATALLPILNPIPNAQEAPPGHHREGLI